MTRLVWIGMTLLLAGCQFLPSVARQPMVHNPFPQLTKVAIAPFFNHSAEPTVNGQQFALAYYNELQKVPGYEVIPVGRVEYMMRAYGITLANVQEARLLAQLLEADAIVIGAVTDYTPYYPPRVGMKVEWYAANPGFHEIPPGYGLPWGTPEEEQIPPPLIFEARMALAREQMKTQTPLFAPLPKPLPAPAPLTLPPAETTVDAGGSGVRTAAHQEVVDAPAPTATTTSAVVPATAANLAAALPPDWPDPRGFTPAPPSPVRPVAIESNKPVMWHVQIYNGNHSEVTEALATYYYFNDDARFGGWQSYLQRSDDFIRFCCHAHISAMLTARGGAGESRVVWRWPTGR